MRQFRAIDRSQDNKNPGNGKAPPVASAGLQDEGAEAGRFLIPRSPSKIPFFIDLKPEYTSCFYFPAGPVLVDTALSTRFQRAALISSRALILFKDIVEVLRRSMSAVLLQSSLGLELHDGWRTTGCLSALIIRGTGWFAPLSALARKRSAAAASRLEKEVDRRPGGVHSPV
jgi:hypothetical protein